MRRCIEIIASLLTAFLSFVSIISCEREFDFGFKDLCFYHPHTAPVKLNVDWSFFRHIERPTGMTVYVWPQEGDEKLNRFLTHNLNYITLNLEAGYYHAFVFNQSDTEYSTLEFHNLENYSKAEARVTQVKSNWYSTRFENDETKGDTKVGDEPEWLAIDCIENISVTEEMVAKAEEEFLAGLPEANGQNKKRDISRSQNEVGPLVPKSIIKNVDIYVHLENLPYLRSGLAAIGGLAEGCYISSGKTTDRKVTHTLESWSVEYHKTESGGVDMMKGALKSSLSTFGLPDGHTGTPEENTLYVRLLLVDNETIVEGEFPVGDLIADLNSYDGTQFNEDGELIWPEIHIYWPEPLPEVEPVGGGSGGFDVGVDDWGDEIETILPLS